MSKTSKAKFCTFNTPEKLGEGLAKFRSQYLEQSSTLPTHVFRYSMCCFVSKSERFKS